MTTIAILACGYSDWLWGWVCGCAGATFGIILDNLIKDRQTGGQK